MSSVEVKNVVSGKTTRDYILHVTTSYLQLVFNMLKQFYYVLLYM